MFRTLRLLICLLTIGLSAAQAQTTASTVGPLPIIFAGDSGIIPTIVIREDQPGALQAGGRIAMAAPFYWISRLDTSQATLHAYGETDGRDLSSLILADGSLQNTAGNAQRLTSLTFRLADYPRQTQALRLELSGVRMKRDSCTTMGITDLYLGGSDVDSSDLLTTQQLGSNYGAHPSSATLRVAVPLGTVGRIIYYCLDSSGAGPLTSRTLRGKVYLQAGASEYINGHILIFARLPATTNTPELTVVRDSNGHWYPANSCDDARISYNGRITQEMSFDILPDPVDLSDLRNATILYAAFPAPANTRPSDICRAMAGDQLFTRAQLFDDMPP